MPNPIPQIPLSSAQTKRQAERLAGVRPDLARAYETALGRWLGDRELMILGRPIVTFGYRPNAEQDCLFAQGRATLDAINKIRKAAGLERISAADASQVVTFKKGGESPHNAKPSAALDVAHLLANGSVVWEPGRLLLFCRLMRAADPRIVWGADWDSDGQTADEKFKDWPHFELTK